jgi:hypothetical protein
MHDALCHGGFANTGEVGSRDEVAARAGGLADSVLGVATDANDAALQRSAAEMFAFASCIGSTGFAAALVRSLVQAMAETTSAPRFDSFTFSFWCACCGRALPCC